MAKLALRVTKGAPSRAESSKFGCESAEMLIVDV